MLKKTQTIVNDFDFGWLVKKMSNVSCEYVGLQRVWKNHFSAVLPAKDRP